MCKGTFVQDCSDLYYKLGYNTMCNGTSVHVCTVTLRNICKGKYVRGCTIKEENTCKEYFVQICTIS